MPGVQAEPSLSSDCSHKAVAFVHRLLTLPAAEQPGLTSLLAELTAVFGAIGAGLANLTEGKTFARHPHAAETRGPWNDDPALLARLRENTTAVTAPRPTGGSFLLAATALATPTPWLLWVEDSKRNAWTDAEAAALALVAQVLGRPVDGNGPSPRWAVQLDRVGRQQRLEIAAVVARRLAHDFGNVLTSILGFTELALTQPVPANSPLQSYLTEVHRGAQSGAGLTHRLRLFSRRQATITRSCNLAAVLAEEEARLRTDPSGIGLQLAVPDPLPALAIDGDHLRQVLSALVENAREAGATSVRIAARAVELTGDDCLDLFGCLRPGAHVEITLADNGAGLSAEVQRGLFAEPFFSTRMRQRGFGLSVAYGILAAHHGGLNLEPGTNGGTNVRVVLPVGKVPVPTAPSFATGPVRGERILVVDDDSMILQLVVKTLEGAGYRVQAVEGGAEAEEAYLAAAADPFRLVLTDVIMPRVSGVDLAQKLLRRDPGVRVLFMSGQAHASGVTEGFAADRFDLLAKPFRPEGLLRAVRQALDRPASRRPTPPGSGAEGASVSASR
jgi:signal transduction histidine kinase/ActR/RegA family two-component response regulator